MAKIQKRVGHKAREQRLGPFFAEQQGGEQLGRPDAGKAESNQRADMDGHRMRPQQSRRQFWPVRRQRTEEPDPVPAVQADG